MASTPEGIFAAVLFGGRWCNSARPVDDDWVVMLEAEGFALIGAAELGLHMGASWDVVHSADSDLYVFEARVSSASPGTALASAVRQWREVVEELELPGLALTRVECRRSGAIA